MNTKANNHLNLFLPQKAPSFRQQKVAEEVRFHLCEIFTRGDLPPVRFSGNSEYVTFDTPLTITYVDVSADLRYAKVLITPFWGRHPDESIQYVRLQAGYIRKLLAGRMKIRHTPQLNFEIDVRHK